MDALRAPLAEAPQAWAEALGVSREAIELFAASEVIDLHVDSFIWTRVLGYQLGRRHRPRLVRGCFFNQVDVPRLRSVGIGGAIWVITTNPLRGGASRARAFGQNLARLRAVLGAEREVRVVRDLAEYREARRAGLHAAFLGIQGGNAIDAHQDLGGLLAERWVLRVTLVHLSNSGLGATSSPLRLGGHAGRLSQQGKEFVRALDAARVFVDLAHVSRTGFFDALEVHDKSLPAIVTHTGVSGVHPHWRNLDDEQLKAIAATGGTVGIMYHSSFLGDPTLQGRLLSIVRHLEHVIAVIGEDHASLGSDWDGAIITPRDMPTCLELPRLVQAMLDRGWTSERIQKVLGGNFLRCLAQLRG
ncbi:MAG TPA: membrane dipeptidase [Polyangiaceae bacterium]|nr:membrane dipeptidase [Polyangiaceae bacterium]